MGIIYNGTSQAIIDAPGDYTIDRDLTQPNPEADCIIINPGVHYVTLRLRSRIVGAGGSGSVNSGIRATGSAAVTVLNDGGSIRGFAYGLRFFDTFIPRVDGLFVQDAWFRGMKIEGDDALIKECDVRNVGGAIWTPNAYCMGIEVSGMSAAGKPKVFGNFVQKVHGVGSGESVGISISDKALGAIVSGNIVKNDTKPGAPFGAGASIGVWCGGQSDVTLSHNTLDVWDYGIAFSSTPTGRVGKCFFGDCTVTVHDSGGDVLVEL
jgi:hypothetical protein